MHKIIICLAIMFSIVNCKNTKQNITINEAYTNFNVIIRAPKDNKEKVIAVQFPQKLNLKNSSYFDQSFIMVDYHYIDSLSKWRNLGIELFKINGQELERVSNNKKKTIHLRDSLNFIYYTRHIIDSSNDTQKQFKPYIEKMLAQNQDTLHIGTVKQFKQKHKELFEKLTKNDSISIQFLDGGKLGERMAVPVKW